MPQTVEIGTSCFIRLNGRTFPGIVVGFWSDSVKGAAVRVETEAAQKVRKPWRSLSFWMRTARMINDRECELVVPSTDEQRAQLEHEVANPPIDDKIKWLAAQAGELPLGPKITSEPTPHWQD